MADALARRLGLRAPDLSWHTERDRLAGVACALGIASGTIAKIGRDIVLLAQTEVGEVSGAAADGRGAVVGHAAQAQPGGGRGAHWRPPRRPPAW